MEPGQFHLTCQVQGKPLPRSLFKGSFPWPQPKGSFGCTVALGRRQSFELPDSLHCRTVQLFLKIQAHRTSIDNGEELQCLGLVRALPRTQGPFDWVRRVGMDRPGLHFSAFWPLCLVTVPAEWLEDSRDLVRSRESRQLPRGVNTTSASRFWHDKGWNRRLMECLRDQNLGAAQQGDRRKLLGAATACCGYLPFLAFSSA